MGWKAPCTDGLDNPKVFMGWKAPATDGLDSPNFLMGWIAPATGLDSPNYFMGWKAPATGLDSPIFSWAGQPHVQILQNTYYLHDIGCAKCKNKPWHLEVFFLDSACRTSERKKWAGHARLLGLVVTRWQAKEVVVWQPQIGLDSPTS